jgi:hypothetical protein
MAAMVSIFLRLQSTDRGMFLPGQPTAGHHQIELACDSCHTPYGGVQQDACLRCHKEDLDIAEDSHPASKFTDPRNAERVAKLDARRCVACHVEHRPEMTTAMGVTLPKDNCFYCHSDIATERPSHEGLAFNSCDSAGCHKFHDNRALYEAFLVKHRAEPDVLETAAIPERAYRRTAPQPLTARDADAPAGTAIAGVVLKQWAGTAHARGGVNCTGCHNVEDAAGAKRWSDRPGYEVCASCHKPETQGFLSGKHGMRLAASLPAMSPSMARLPMRLEAEDRELNCLSCHASHDFDTSRAAVDACLDCHADKHSLSYKASPHFVLWRSEFSGPAAAGSGVSCATCHLPREVHQEGDLEMVRVQHNQNWNLRPNEKMIRDVCMSCHGLAFSIDALADRTLIEMNFRGRPSRHIESIDMAARKASQ